jgi:hypothetical protein
VVLTGHRPEVFCWTYWTADRVRPGGRWAAPSGRGVINTSNVTDCYIASPPTGCLAHSFNSLHLAPPVVSSAEINTLRHIDHTFERLYATEQPVLASLRQTKA